MLIALSIEFTCYLSNLYVRASSNLETVLGLSHGILSQFDFWGIKVYHKNIEKEVGIDIKVLVGGSWNEKLVFKDCLCL